MDELTLGIAMVFAMVGFVVLAVVNAREMRRLEKRRDAILRSIATYDSWPKQTPGPF